MNEFFLRLNASKTKIMVIAPSSVKCEIPINGTVIDGECIRFVDKAKNLGVILDSELSFSLQINKVVSSCLQTIRNISRIRKFLNEQQLKTLVSTLVFSKLDYCNSLYFGLNAQSINKLQVVQNSALRVIYGINRYDRISVTPLFTRLHWLKIRERIIFKLLLIIYKCLMVQEPYDLRNMLQLSLSDRTKKLASKRSVGTYGNRSFSVAAPKLWNALPQHIREEPTITKYKKLLKSYLMTHYETYFQSVNMK